MEVYLVGIYFSLHGLKEAQGCFLADLHLRKVVDLLQEVLLSLVQVIIVTGQLAAPLLQVVDRHHQHCLSATRNGICICQDFFDFVEGQFLVLLWEVVCGVVFVIVDGEDVGVGGCVWSGRGV